MDVIERLGDVDPYNYGGGVVFAGEGGAHWLWYWYGLDQREDVDEDEEPEDVEFEVYAIEVPEDVNEEYDWGMTKSFKDCIDHKGEFGSGLRERAQAIVDLAGYYGWENIPHWKTKVKGSELMAQFDED